MILRRRLGVRRLCRRFEGAGKPAHSKAIAGHVNPGLPIARELVRPGGPGGRPKVFVDDVRMPAPRSFTPNVLEALRSSKYVWIRAGEEHRFIAIWAVVVGGRLFVRSWNAKPRGWHQAFVDNKRGAIRLAKDGEEIAVHAVQTKSERLKAAVDRGFAEKYTTASSLKYVKGFRLPKRRDTTIELVPTIMLR